MILQYIFEELEISCRHPLLIKLVVEAILESVIRIRWVDAKHLVIALEHVDNFLSLLHVLILLPLR